MSLMQSLKDFFHKAGDVYKDICKKSGGCGYIPPNCLSTPQKKETNSKEPLQPEK